MLMLLLLLRCWLRLRSAVSENSTLKVKWGLGIRQVMQFCVKLLPHHTVSHAVKDACLQPGEMSGCKLFLSGK